MRRELVTTRLRGSMQALASLEAQTDGIVDLIARAVSALDGGALLLTAGNGGSAAQAMHLAEELIGRYRSNRPPRRAVCLNADPTALTCIANDFGYDAVFARPCEALLGRGDVLCVFSTSGNSANLVAALKVARQRGAVTLGLLGRDGGACLPLCDAAVVVGATDSAHIQEAHQVILHLLCESLEPAVDPSTTPRVRAE